MKEKGNDMFCNAKINYEFMKEGITRYLTSNGTPVKCNVEYLEIMMHIPSSSTYVTYIRNEILILAIFI